MLSGVLSPYASTTSSSPAPTTRATEPGEDVPTTTSWNLVYILPGLLDVLVRVVVVEIDTALSDS